MGAKGNDVCLSKLILSCRGFRLCGGDKGAMETDEVCGRPLDPFAAHTTIVDFFRGWGIPLLRERELLRRDASLPATKVPCLTFLLE